MTNIYSKDIYEICQKILSKLSSKEIHGLRVDNGEYVNKRFESFTSGQLQKELGISYDILLESIRLLQVNGHIETTTPQHSDKGIQVVLNTEKTNCEILQNGYNAFVQGFYRKLISDIEHEEKLKLYSTQQHNSIIETNKNVRLTNRIIWISVAASIVSAYAAVVSSNSSNDLIIISTLLKRQDSVLQKVTNRQRQTDTILSNQAIIIDSLKKRP